jgi:hypothetical protein
MTIRFNCPNCGELIAFADKHRGKRAHCSTCRQRFVIPSQSNEKPKKVKPPKDEEIARPIPGFYRAVFVGSWRLFTNFRNAAGLVFIMTVVVFKFFAANQNISLHIQGEWLSFDFYIPLGWVSRGAAWGFLFWFYSEMIYSTGFDQDELPTVTIGGFYTLIWKIAKSVYEIFVILLVVGLPAFLAFLILRYIRVELPVLLYSLVFGGLFLLPMAILTVAIGRDLTMLRPDYLLAPIRKAFTPYLVTTVILGGALVLQTFTSQYEGQSPDAAAVCLLLNFLVQSLVLVAMRSIGLFWRHYSCHFIW